MGVGSAFYKNYYMGLGLVYIIVGIIPLGQMKTLETCKSICPLNFADRDWKLWACDLQKVDWNSEEGYRNAWKAFDQNVTGPCFVWKRLQRSAFCNRVCPVKRLRIPYRVRGTRNPQAARRKPYRSVPWRIHLILDQLI